MEKDQFPFFTANRGAWEKLQIRFGIQATYEESKSRFSPSSRVGEIVLFHLIVLHIPKKTHYLVANQSYISMTHPINNPQTSFSVFSFFAASNSGSAFPDRCRMTRLLTALGFVTLATSAHAAAILGTPVVGAKDAAGINIANGSLGLLIVDVQGDGFIGLPNGTTGTLDATDNPGVTEGAAGLGVGNTFGGELVLAQLTSSSTSGVLSGSVSFSLTIEMYFRQFAIVWFDQIKTSSAPANAPEGSTFGVVQGTDWILPPTNSGVYSFSPTDASGASSFYQTNLTNNPVAAISFRTTNGVGVSAASFTVVPEPSSALLVGLGVMLPLVTGRRRVLT